MKSPIAPLLALSLTAACGDPAPAPAPAAAPPPTPPARVAAASAPAATSGYLGVLLPRQAIDVSAPTSGRLEAVYARAGDRLRAGAPIARLDAESLRHQLESARASLREAAAAEHQAELALADAKSRQQRRLSIPESFSKEDLAQAEIQKQQAEAALESAEARVAGQRAQVREMEKSLADAEVRSPFAGTVAQRYLDAGATVGPGTPIVRLVSEGESMIRFAVPPADAARLAIGAQIVAEAPGGAALPGIVERIAPEIDPASRMIFVEARLAGGGHSTAVPPGAVVRVRRS